MLSLEEIEKIKTQSLLGFPTNLNGVCNIYPLKIPEIVEMGMDKYFQRVGTLLLNENQIADIIKEKTGHETDVSNINVLEYLIQSSTQSDTFLLELQNIFSTFLKEDVLLLPKINAVLVGPPEEKRLITRENFPILQDVIRVQNRREVPKAPPENETAGQRKMRLLRERVAEVKRKQAEKNGESQSLSNLLEIGMVFGIDINNCTLYAFYSLLSRHQRKEKWESDLRMIAAGADSKKLKAKYWGDSSSEEEGG